MNERLRIGIAEAIGTMILVVGGPGTAILATGHFTGSMNTVGILGVALAFGLSLLVAAYAIGSISGCHINPAVTVGLWVIGKTKTIELPFGLGQHFFFDCGGGDALAFFWFPDAPERAPGISGPAARPTRPPSTVPTPNWPPSAR